MKAIRRDFPHSVRVLENVWIPVADGCRLSAKIWLPESAESEPVPALLEYIPYRKNDGTAVGDSARHAYLAGHGYFDPVSKFAYLVTTDSKRADRDNGTFESFLSGPELVELADRLDCKHIFLCVDACDSGTFDKYIAVKFAGTRSIGSSPYEAQSCAEIIQNYLTDRTRVGMASSHGVKDVSDGIAGRNSPFANRFLKAMRDAAKNPSGGAGLGAGLGAGFAVGGAMANALGGAMNPQQQQSQNAQGGATKVKCPKCGAANVGDSKFCNECGAKMEVAAETVPCVKCEAQLPAGAKFCNHCGAKQEKPKCPNCQHEVAPGTKFCNECGTKIEQQG